MTGKGVAYARQRAKERQARFSSPFLFLRENGERARIRFLTGTEEFFQGMFHRPYDGQKVKDPIVCPETDDRPPVIEGMGEECPLCAQDDKSLSYKYFSWVYVYYILHPNQNPRLEKDANAPKWKAVKMGKGASAATFYRQDINKVKMMLFGQAIFDDLLALNMEAVAESEAEDDDGSGLLGRDYSYVRNGARKDPKTTYTFVPGKDSELSEEVSKAISSLPALEEAALAGTRAFYGAPEPSDDEEEAETVEEIESADEEAEEEEAEVEVADEEDFKEL